MRCRRSALLVLAVMLVMSATAVVALTEENNATVMPADVAGTALAATYATVVPAEGIISDDGSSVASSSGDPFTLTPHTPTETPVTTSPATASPSTTAPTATTALPTITGAAAETAAPTAAPVATQAPTTAPVATQAPTAAPAATTAAPVSTTAAPAATVAPASTTAAPASTSAAPTSAPAATEAPTTAPVATQAPTAAPIATTAAPVATTAAPVATQAPTAAPVTEAPTTAPVATTTAPPATTTPAATPTATTEAPAATTPTPTTAETTTSSPVTSEPDASSSSLSSTSDSAANSATSTAKSSGDNGADTSTRDGLGNSGGLTLSPITSDDSGANTHTTDSSSGSNPTNASTSSGTSNSFGGWKLALVIVGAFCAVMASIFFVHTRHVRTAAANKRSRGSSQQRALDSFFQQNRVTVARETGVSSGNFVDPLTPCDEIAVTFPSNKSQDQPRTDTADIIAGSAAQAFNRRTTRTGNVVGPSASILTPTSSTEYDSFTGRHHAPSTVSTNSSNFYRSNSVYSDTSSLGSIAPSATSSQRSVQISTFPSRMETVASQGRAPKRASAASSIRDVCDTNRSDRSSSDSEDVYRISTQLIDVAALPVSSELRGSHDSYLSRDSDELSEFSVDECYSNESFGTVDSYASRSTNSDSIVFRTSKESELSEGEI